jgi:subtilisin-like proprotein convertase family protein
MLCLLSKPLNAQIFEGLGDSIPELSNPLILEMPVSGLPVPILSENFGLRAVHLEIKHSYLENLSAYLMSPEGTVVKLFTNAGGNGKNMVGTILCDTATLSVQKNKLAPYTGRFQAQDKLGNFNRYQSAEGIWKLFIRDDANFDRGKIESWKLEFGYNVTGPDTFSSNIPLLEIFTLKQSIMIRSLSAEFR